MFDDPIGKRSLKANIATRFLGFDPLVFHYFLTFRLELAVKRRISQQIFSRQWLFGFF